MFSNSSVRRIASVCPLVMREVFAMALVVLLWVISATAAPVQADPVLTTLHQFCLGGSGFDCPDGAVPESSLLRGPDGTLYGVTIDGGALGFGAVFMIAPDGKQRVIHSFCHLCKEGETPYGRLIMDTNGTLYGTAANGGAFNGGTVFRLKPPVTGKHWRLSVVYSFCSQPSCADSQTPATGLVYQGWQNGSPWDGISPLFGTTDGAGQVGNWGAVYQLTFRPGAGKAREKILYAFCKSDGCDDGGEAFPQLAIDAAGNLYGGTTYGGIDDHGVVYELSPKGRKYVETTLYRFCQQVNCADGSSPSGVSLDANGNVVGTTQAGGAHQNSGVAFSIVPNGVNSQETVLYNFCSLSNCADGKTPRAGLLLDPNGDLIGVTRGGGSGGGGTVFKLHGATQSVLYNFCTDCEVFTPDALPIFDPEGNLLGTSAGELFSNYGAVYSLTP